MWAEATWREACALEKDAMRLLRKLLRLGEEVSAGLDVDSTGLQGSVKALGEEISAWLRCDCEAMENVSDDSSS